MNGKRPTSVIPREPDPAGRVIFLLQNSKDFLFFIPNKFDSSLKFLEGSMWFKINNEDHGVCYRAAASVEALEWLRDTLGKINISKPVFQWYTEVTTVTPVENDTDIPLMGFQLEAIGFLKERPKAMLSLSPGLGKTLCSISAVNQFMMGMKILVVAPLSLLYMWKSEIEKWQPNLSKKPMTHIWHKDIEPVVLKTFNPRVYSDLWVILNPETLTKHLASLEKMKFDLLILDESILYKNRKSKRTKAVEKLARSIPRVWQLTGAPANRLVDDLWSQFHILKPKIYTSYWRFAKEYTLVEETGWGGKAAANKRDTEEVIKRRFRDIYFARAQEEVLDLPPLLFENINLPMTSYQEQVYWEIKNELISTVFEATQEFEDDVVVSVNNHLSQVVRLIQIASNPMLVDGDNSSGKWEAVPELINLYDPPYLFWTSFVRTSQMLQELLTSKGLRTNYMIGATSSQDRQRLVDNFQAGKLDAIIVGQQVGSFGHTMTAARTAFYGERTFDGSYFQSLKRIHRIGTKVSPVAVNLLSVYKDGKQTIDHLVNSMLDYRVGMIRNLTTGMLRNI